MKPETKLRIKEAIKRAWIIRFILFLKGGSKDEQQKFNTNN